MTGIKTKNAMRLTVEVIGTRYVKRRRTVLVTCSAVTSVAEINNVLPHLVLKLQGVVMNQKNHMKDLLSV